MSAPFEGEVGEPNTLGGYLLFIGMVAAGLAAKIRQSRAIKLLLLLIVCLVPPFFFTQSRSSYLALVPAMMVLGFMTERRLIIVGLLSLGLLVSPLFLPGVVKERILYTFNQPQEPGQIVVGDLRLDTSTSARLQSWQDALKDFSNHPFLGYGVTGYPFIDAQFPRVLTETGLLGLSAFIYLLVSLLRMTLQRLKQTNDPYFRGLIMGFIAGFTGLLVHSIGTNTFILVRIMEPFWFVAGIIAVLPMIQSQPYAPAATDGRPIPVRLPARARSTRRPLIFPSRLGKGVQISAGELPRD